MQVNTTRLGVLLAALSAVVSSWYAVRIDLVDPGVFGVCGILGVVAAFEGNAHPLMSRRLIPALFASAAIAVASTATHLVIALLIGWKPVSWDVEGPWTVCAAMLVLALANALVFLFVPLEQDEEG